MIYGTSIWFPNLGIELKDVGMTFDILGFEIAYYGLIIAIGMGAGYFIAEWMAKRTNQNTEVYADFALYAIIASVIGARLYYVIFDWKEYVANPMEIFNIRNGGLAIYGAVIAAVITALLYCKIKKYSFTLLADTGVIGLITGQIIGRWGNFFNREAFGKYTNGITSMLLDIRDVGPDYNYSLQYLTEKYAGKEDALNRIIEIRENLVTLNGATYVSVHPTFLYESLWNVGVLLLLIFYTKHKKFDGEIFLLYLAGYGLGRVWIEGMRTDQLFLWNSPFAVSQVLSAVLVLASIGAIIVMRKRVKKSRV